MNLEPKFNQTITSRIWDDYFNRAARILNSAPKENRDELILELKGHLYENFLNQQGEGEADRLMNAIVEMGILEEFLKPIVADKLLHNASQTFSPVTLMYGLFYSLFSGIKRGVLAFVIGLAYLLLLVFPIMAILKLFSPDNVGLFLPHDGGNAAFGYIIDPAGQMTEVLGYWIIPINLALMFIIYFGLTRLLRFFVKRTS